MQWHLYIFSVAFGIYEYLEVAM